MTNIEIALYVFFGMVAGGPIWLLLLTARRNERRLTWRVVDRACKRLEG